MSVVKRLTKKANFAHPGLIEEALTHPSAIYQEVPSYQLLEWCGDAVLCLAMREWVYTEFPDMPVGDMVTLEGALVSNEMLCYQCVKTGLHRFINHRDQSLPSRLEHYEWAIGEMERGVWGTDPPKVLSDVVEAVFGACHKDGGLVEGQAAVLSFMSPILESIRAMGGHTVQYLRHPKTALNELGGKFLRIHVAREDNFVRNSVSTGTLKVWQGTRWRIATMEGVASVGTVRSMGIDLISVVEPSGKAARNRACALVVEALESDAEILERVREVTRVVQGAKPNDDSEGGSSDERGEFD
jgi:dsRNA-specific ribonuclease